jgi:hypothetical protein
MPVNQREKKEKPAAKVKLQPASKVLSPEELEKKALKAAARDAFKLHKENGTGDYNRNKTVSRDADRKKKQARLDF